MNWTIAAALAGIVLPLIISWLIYLTITITEVDRSQEAVQQHNKDQDGKIETLRSLPSQVLDRYTGKEADIANKNVQREIDHIIEDLKNHRHQHKDVIHGDDHK